MDLSLQKDSFDWGKLEQVDLIQEKIRLSGGQEFDLSLETIWPGFLFLKAMGFEILRFHSQKPNQIQTWMQRIEAYQQSFLEDPEAISIEECTWNEIDEISLDTVIECIQKTSRVDHRPASLYPVPPMEAPLSVEPHALRSFLNEVHHQRDEDILLRLQSILQEFKNDSKNIEEELWTNLVGDIIALALRTRQLDKASKLATEHHETLKNLWFNTDRSLQILSSFEASRSNELQSWNQIFSTLPTDRLIYFFQNHLSSPAGPQIVRLMSIRVKERPNDFAKLCFECEQSSQKLLLQWLSPYWGPQHYRQLYAALLRALKGKSELELIQALIQALLRSYRIQALKDLSLFFTPKTWLKRIFSRTPHLEAQKQKSILNALAEIPSADTIVFLKEIRPSLKGEVADYVERLLQSYRGRSLK